MDELRKKYPDDMVDYWDYNKLDELSLLDIDDMVEQLGEQEYDLLVQNSW